MSFTNWLRWSLVQGRPHWLLVSARHVRNTVMLLRMQQRSCRLYLDMNSPDVLLQNKKDAVGHFCHIVTVKMQLLVSH